MASKPPRGETTAAHLIEPSSVARHNRPAQRDRTDDSDASLHTPAVSHHGAPNNPRALTPLDTARSFMDDNQPSFLETTGSSRRRARLAAALRDERRPRLEPKRSLTATIGAVARGRYR